MADRYLIQVRELPEQHQIVEVQVVPRIDAQLNGMGEGGGAFVARERCLRLRLASLERPRERLRVQLDPVRSDVGRPPNGGILGIDEEAHPDARRLECTYGRLDGRARSVRPPTGLTGNLAWNNRSEEHTSELQSLRHLVCRLL